MRLKQRKFAKKEVVMRQVISATITSLKIVLCFQVVLYKFSTKYLFEVLDYSF